MMPQPWRHFWPTQQPCFSGFIRVGALLCMLTLAPPVSAEPLKLNGCLNLWRHSLAAKSNGTDALLRRGSVGAKTRLSATQLSQVKAYIEQIEQLRFKCRTFIPPPPGAEIP